MNDTGVLSKLEECVLELHKVGVVKFGDFTLKSGMQSPVYFDLRIIISFPRLMRTVSELLWEASPDNQYKQVCGVAYTGIPLATIISQMQDLPMVVRRKETKSYGTKKLVEGVYSAGDSCLIVEDVLVSGSSVYETVETLRELELDVQDAVVFLDRQQGGLNSLAKLGINIVPVVTLSKMMSILKAHGRVTQSVVDEVVQFISTHNDTRIVTQQQKQLASAESCARVRERFNVRSAATSHPVARRLLATMDTKRSNLCVAADVASSQDLLQLAKEVGPHICLLKTHVDTLPDFTVDTAKALQQLAQEMDFLLFEDSKFVDIGTTASRQYRQRALWADLVTAAPVLGGDGVLKGLADGASGHGDKGVVLVAEMSSTGAFRSKEYTDACLKMADQHPYLVLGFVCQSVLTSDPRLIQMTPGVSLSAEGDSLGQRYASPSVAVLDRGADIIIVGRGVTQASDRVAAAKQYQELAYEAYEQRVGRL